MDKVIIYYSYSELDKQHCYYVYIKYEGVFLNWIWFYIGKHLKEKDILKCCIYPWKPDKHWKAKIIKVYKHNHSSGTIGRNIALFLNKDYRIKNARRKRI